MKAVRAKTPAYYEMCKRRDRRKSQAIRELITAAKQGGCVRCGYDKSVYALNFHHRDPAEKKFNIGGTKLSLVTLQEEIDKCDVLCANCHMELTHTKETYAHADA